jgi:DNA-binding MarR family transcriptional regulator
MDNRSALALWRAALVEAVRREGPDLSARQMAILLTVYLSEPPHTVRGLAAQLNVSKPAVTRALDRLGRLGLARRKIDAADRRNVLVQRTVRGSVFLSEFADLIAAAERERDAPDGERTGPGTAPGTARRPPDAVGGGEA